MQRLDGSFVYSASGLNNYLECKRLVELDSLVARAKLIRPDVTDEQAELLRRKGEAHEAAHLAALQKTFASDEIAAFYERPENSRAGYARAEAATLAEMRRGASVPR